MRRITMTRKLWLPLFYLMMVFAPLLGHAADWVPLNGAQALAEAPAIELQSSDFNSIRLTIAIPGFMHETIATESGDFSYIMLDGEGYTTQIGHPQLPVIRRMIEIPFGANPELIVGRTIMREDDMSALQITHRIMPAQPPIEKIPGALQAARFEMDRAAYSQAEYMIGEVAGLRDGGIIRGHRFVLLEIYPFDYNPAGGTLRIINSIEIEIRLNGADRALTRQMKQRYADPYTEALTDRLFLNAGTLDDLDLPLPPLGFIVVTNNHYAGLPVVQNLVTWKEQKGYHVTVATTEVIGSSTTQIKNYIQDAYDNWSIPPTHVLLIGDVNVIPEWIGTGTGSPHTDLNYGLLQGGDSFADVGVGRFSPSTDAELANMVNKTLEYEQVGWVVPDTWEKYAVFMASTDNYQVSEGTHNYVIDNYLIPDGYQVDKLYTVTYSATTAQVSASFNAGRSIGCYSGHGSTTSWADGPPFSQSNVRALTNEVYPFVFSFACLTGQFQLGECFGETWSRDEHAALAFWGASVSSYWGEDDILEKKCFEGIFDEQLPGEDQNLTWLSGFTGYGMYMLWQHYGGGGMCQRYVEMYNILGDPSVDLWTDVPQDLTVNIPGAILIGMNQLEVTVSGYQDWALVHIYSDAEDLKFTDYVNNGAVTFNLGSGFTVPGTLHVWVTGHDCMPYHGTSSIIPPSGPYVIFNSLEVDDSALGNNNGQLDYSETVELSIYAENVGVAAANNVTLTITSLDPLLTVIDGTEFLGSLAPGAVLGTNNGFTVQTSSELPDEYAIPCQLDATDGIEIWTTTFTITGHAPVVDFDALTVHDDTGNQNGNLDPGESADMEVTLRNNGSTDVDNVAFTASTTDPYITITSAGGTVGSLPVGGTNSGTFSVDVSSSCPQEHSVRFTLDITGSNGYAVTTEFSSIVGNILYNVTGPDNYGYTAYDPFDAPEFPVYEWTEICADSGGPGTLVNFTSDDQTFQFDLPFDFGYYGLTYNRYTIGANGWVGMGDILEDDYSNSGIPNDDGPAPMIAPYWEDLSPQRTNSGKVWNWYDAANHRLIVEYNHIEQYAPTGSFETFQVILLDPAYYQTSTNDGRIIFQYKDMSNSVQNEGTVGIENAAENDGIEVLYDGDYDQYIQHIQSGLAILFSTPTTAPTMDVALTYVSGSPVPAGGGDLIYDLYVENIGSTAAAFDGWLYVSYEGGVPTTLVQRSFTNFLPGWSINRPGMFYPISGSYAAGNYEFGLRVGSHPSTVWAEDNFPFEKSGTDYVDGFIPFPVDGAPNPFDRIAGIEDGVLEVIPKEYSLDQNYPNPFNPTTAISYQLSAISFVNLTVYDIAGRQVAELVNGMRDAGVHDVTFDASNLSSGIYFYRIEAGDFTSVRKMVLMK